MRAKNPYVGPRPFQIGETLYGREQEVMELLDLLIAERIVLLYSPSGAGKTSLLQAGLIPELQYEDFHVLPVMRVSLEPASEQTVSSAHTTNPYILSLLLSLEARLPSEEQFPLEELTALSFRQYLEQRQVFSGEGDHVVFLASPDGHEEWAEGEAPRIVLVFDQFEEILTVNPNDRERKKEFFAQVGAILRHADCWAVFSMREEFPAGLDPYVRYLPTRLTTTFRLELLGEEAASEAMQEPAAQAGMPFTEAAALKLINDLRRVRIQASDGSTSEQLGLYVEPVQLQVVCHRLWHNLPEEAVEIQEQDLQKAGDVDSALSGYYADRLSLTARQIAVHERVLREWFAHQLITKQGIRGQVLRGPEQSQGLDNNAIEPLLDAHLVRAEKRRGATWYELAHDRLIEPIRKNNARWFLENLSPLQRQAEIWEERGRADGLLLRGEALHTSEQWAKEHATELTDVEREFLKSCLGEREQREKQRRTNRLIRRLFVGAIAAAVLAILVAAFAIVQRLEAERLRFVSLAQSLAVQSERQQEFGQYERAILLARQAYLFNKRYQGTMFNQVDHALRYAFSSPYFNRILSFDRIGTAVTASPDGKLVAQGDQDGNILVWNLQNSEVETELLEGHTAIIWSLAFSPDGKTLASAGSDRSIRLWDLEDASSDPVVLEGHRAIVFSLAFRSDGETLASGSLDGTIRVWDLQKPESDPLLLDDHEGSVNAVVFSPDGTLMASGGADGSVRLWPESGSGKKMKVFLLHEGSVNALTFSPDGRWLASGGEDENILLWDLAKNMNSPFSTPFPPIFLEHVSDEIFSLHFSQNTEMLIAAGRDRQLQQWDLGELSASQIAPGKLALSRSLPGHEESVYSSFFSAAGEFLVTSSQDGSTRLWDFGNDEGETRLLRSFRLNQSALEDLQDEFLPPELLARLESLVDRDFSKEKDFWDAVNAEFGDGSQLTTSRKDALSEIIHAHHAPVSDIEFLVDSRRLNVVSRNGIIRQWNLEEIDAGAEILRHEKRDFQHTQLSPDGRLLAFTDAEGKLRVSNLDHPELTPFSLTTPDKSLFKLFAFSPDGKNLAAVDQRDKVWFWPAIKSKQEAIEFVNRDRRIVVVLAFDPKGKYLYAGFNYNNAPFTDIVRWKLDSPNNSPQKLGIQGCRFQSFELSPDGEFLASTCANRSGRLWRLSDSGKPLKVLRGHLGSLDVVSFSPDGRYLASGGEDGIVRLWDLQNLQANPVLLRGHGNRVSSLSFHPNGDFLAAGGQDGSVAIWKPLDALSEIVCQKAGRNLSQDEWRQFVGEGVPYEQTCFSAKD